MTHQQPLALVPPAGAADWSEQALINARTVTTIAGVNEAFLALLVRLAGERPGQPVLGVPPAALRAIATCGAQRCLEAASLPYALFDLRFLDERYWATQAAGTAAVHDAEAAGHVGHEVVAFVQTAVTAAWHLAQLSEGGARLALGMAAGTHGVLAALPMSALAWLPRRLAPALAARFCARGSFWPLFAECAARPTDERAAALRRLGLQLTGMEGARAQSLHRRTHGNP
jgi:hypothetical protein